MTQPLKPARVRIAPSPTGRAHLGNARTALYDYLFARQTGGQFVLRIEDTDQKRFVPGAEQELVDSLHWLGLEWDEGPDVGGPHAPYRQSERKEIYLEHARWLVDHGHAYPCFCSPERLQSVRQEQQKRKENPHYDGTCRRLDPILAAKQVAQGERHVIRFKTPQDGSITAHDFVRGEITVENRSLDDYVLVKSDGLALYHLAAMVDDYLMGITHVLRGAEWLPTFPLHVHIYKAFGWQQPEWVHLSLFLKPSGKGKMSKREASTLMKDGYSIFIGDLKELGYIPEAVDNWMALMGWSFDDHTEFFTLDSLIESFSLERLNPSPAAINFTKLDHFNGLHIRSLEVNDLSERIKPFFQAAGYQADDGKLAMISPIIQERMVTLDEAPIKTGFLFKEQIEPSPEDLIGKKMTIDQSAEAAKRAYQVLERLPEINALTAEEPMRALAEEMGLKVGQLFGILRIAVTGQRVSPPLFESMEIIGRALVLLRLNNAAKILDEMVAKS